MVLGLTTSSRDSSRTEGKFVLRLQLAAGNRLADLPAQLLIDGEAAGGVDVKFHGGPTVLDINTVNAYCCQAGKSLENNRKLGRGRIEPSGSWADSPRSRLSKFRLAWKVSHGEAVSMYLDRRTDLRTN